MSEADVVVPEDVQAFAREQGVEAYLPAVLQTACRVFPDAEVSIILEEDYEEVDLRYLVIVVRPQRLSVAQALEASERYYRDLFACVPAPRIGAFRLDLEPTS
jgi:hypothetical protein